MIRRPLVVAHMRALLLCLALVLLGAPLAGAQVPNTNTCGPFTLATTTPDNVAPGGSVSVTVTIKNEGNLAATVNVSSAFASSDAGWHVSPPAQSSNDLQPNTPGSAIFTVAADKGASPTATLNLAATGVCGGPGPLPCPAPQCTVQAKALSVPLSLQPQQGFRLPAFASSPFLDEYLVAGLVLVVVTVAIVLLMRRRRPAGAMLTCPEPLKFVKAGRGASFPIEVRNHAAKPARLALCVGAVPEGWSAFLPLPDIQLAANEVRGLWLMVRAPESAKTGDAVDVEIVATDAALPNKPKKMRVRAEVSETGAAEN